jgi:alkanesulfonate monooxygenase SsuD/methylene tetrahydromethanopterin reductase-like flavin-dependent oxidoreductase (luciferase family)
MSLIFEWVDPSSNAAADPVADPAAGRVVRLRIQARPTGEGAAAPGLLSGSYDDVAERISEYADLGIDRFLLVADDQVREREHFDRGVVPALERRGLLTRTTPAGGEPAGVGRV